MSTFHETAIAAAIAGKLPFGYPVIPAPSTDPGASGDAVVVTFTGSPGARRPRGDRVRVARGPA